MLRTILLLSSTLALMAAGCTVAQEDVLTCVGYFAGQASNDDQECKEFQVDFDFGYAVGKRYGYPVGLAEPVSPGEYIVVADKLFNDLRSSKEPQIGSQAEAVAAYGFVTGFGEGVVNGQIAATARRLPSSNITALERAMRQSLLDGANEVHEDYN